ncbi:MAG: hypothetical protein OXF73_00355 [Gammaproteobacteria bacterium]|nr:hypothetical protein [Gammaproteobacteria bacterium]
MRYGSTSAACCGGLESGADREPPEAPGRGDGGPGVDLPPGPGGRHSGRGRIPGRVRHRRASGGGEEPHRRPRAGHGHRREAPGSATLPGGQDVEVHHPGAPGQTGRGRGTATTHGGAPGTCARPDCGQQQGVCRPPGGLRRAGDVVLPCHSWEPGLNEHAA